VRAIVWLSLAIGMLFGVMGCSGGSDSKGDLSEQMKAAQLKNPTHKAPVKDKLMVDTSNPNGAPKGGPVATGH